MMLYSAFTVSLLVVAQAQTLKNGDRNQAQPPATSRLTTRRLGLANYGPPCTQEICGFQKDKCGKGLECLYSRKKYPSGNVYPRCKCGIYDKKNGNCYDYYHKKEINCRADNKKCSWQLTVGARFETCQDLGTPKGLKPHVDRCTDKYKKGPCHCGVSDPNDPNDVADKGAFCEKDEICQIRKTPRDSSSCVNICQLSPDSGSGKENLPRFYFDASTSQCKEFSFHGGIGNENKWGRKQDCEFNCIVKTTTTPTTTIKAAITVTPTVKNTTTPTTTIKAATTINRYPRCQCLKGFMYGKYGDCKESARSLFNNKVFCYTRNDIQCEDTRRIRSEVGRNTKMNASAEACNL